eukprot:43060_1
MNSTDSTLEPTTQPSQYPTLQPTIQIDGSIGDIFSWYETLDKYEITLLFLIVVVICLVLFGLYCRACCKLRKQKKQIKSKTCMVTNPLVIAVNIAYYDEEPENCDEEMRDVYVEDLPVEYDYQSILRMCNKYNYDLYPTYHDENPKLRWSQ